MAVAGELDPAGETDAKSCTNSVAQPTSRDPTSQDGTSFVSASIAMNVQTSPKPKTPFFSAGTFFAFA